MSAESEGFLRLLGEVAEDVDTARKRSQRAGKRVEALLALLRAVDRSARPANCPHDVCPAPDCYCADEIQQPRLPGPPPPTADQIRAFVCLFDILAREVCLDADNVAVRTWLVGFAGGWSSDE